MSNPRSSLIKIVSVLLLLFPVIYLFMKSPGAKPADLNPIAAPVSNDIPVLEEMVKKDPSYDNLVNLSMAYINKQMPGKSVDHLKKAIGLKPNSAIAYNNLGVAYTMMQQYQNGVDACTKALQIDPGFQLAKNNLKWATDEKNKVTAAIKLQEQTPENKRDVAFYSAYGLNYFKLSDYDKCIEIWNKVFDLDPKNADALNSIGTAFMMKNQVDDAIALFKKAIELQPANQLAKNNLAWATGEKEKK